MSVIAQFKVGKTEFVLIPRAEYLRMRSIPKGSVDAVAFADQTIVRGLRAARETAGLSQVELARKLRVSQSMVANTEAGRSRAGERYLLRVLKACGLPKYWRAPTR